MVLHGVVRCRAGAVTSAGVWYGPGSAKQAEEALHRARDTVMFNRAAFCSNRLDRPAREHAMDRRNFMAGCAALSLTAKAGAALGQSGPLTRIIFPFAAGGS